MSRVPMMAGATPPPTSPSGSGRSVKNATLSAATPLTNTSSRMIARIATPKAAHATTAPNMTWSTSLRRADPQSEVSTPRAPAIWPTDASRCIGTPSGSRHAAAGELPDDQAGQRVDDAADDQQYQRHVHDRREVDILVGLTELVRDGARHRVARREQREVHVA